MARLGMMAAALSFAALVLAAPVTATAGGPVLEGMLDDSAYESLRAAGRLQSVPGGSGFVYVEVSPSDASVRIGNKKFKEAPPFTAENVPTGYQRVEITARGAQPVAGWVLVEPLKVARVRIFVPSEPGNVTVLADPPGADVYVDGQLVGQSPLTIERLSAGRHEVLLKSGDLAWAGSVDVAGGTEVLRAKLARDRNVRVATAPAPQPVVVSQPVVVPQPVVTQPVVTPEPVAPTPVATRPASPSGQPAPGGRAVDLRSLSPSLRAMAWQNLTGKQVEVELVNGAKATVQVGAVEGSSVVLKMGGEGRLVPLEHIVSVTE